VYILNEWTFFFKLCVLIILFPNQVLQIGNHLRRNIYSLVERLKEGLVAAKNEEVEITSVGIDFGELS
jgi:hypothetical protein